MQYSLTVNETIERADIVTGRDNVKDIQLGRLTGPYDTLCKVSDVLMRVENINTSLNVILPLDRGYAHIPEERFVDAIEQYQADKRPAFPKSKA